MNISYIITIFAFTQSRQIKSFIETVSLVIIYAMHNIYIHFWKLPTIGLKVEKAFNVKLILAHIITRSINKDLYLFRCICTYQIIFTANSTHCIKNKPILFTTKMCVAKSLLFLLFFFLLFRIRKKSNTKCNEQHFRKMRINEIHDLKLEVWQTK